MMAMLTMKESPEDAVMTADSPDQSFKSTDSGAMDLDNATNPDDSGVDVNSPPSLPPTSPSDQHINALTAHHHISPNPINTTYQTPTASPTFTGLPLAIRSLIYSLAAPAPRTRILELHTYNTIDHTPRLRYIPPLPPLFSTTRESRTFSIAHEGGEIVPLTPETFTALFSFHGRKIGEAEHVKEQDRGFYFNFTRDIVWLGARFTGACNTTETQRLTTLSCILPPVSLSRIQRLIVSYSGLDSYALIGPVFRPFAHLETLYLCVNDGRMKEDVKMLLAKGVPAAGAIAAKVKSMVEEAEAEETDDDEESKEVAQERLAVRAMRRVLEVELRLEE